MAVATVGAPSHRCLRCGRVSSIVAGPDDPGGWPLCWSCGGTTRPEDGLEWVRAWRRRLYLWLWLKWHALLRWLGVESGEFTWRRV